MPYFNSPKVLFGKDALKKLSFEMKGKGNKAALITDGTMVDHTDGLVEAMENAGFTVKIWADAETDPSLDTALSCSKVLLDFEPQWIIGFGGGSAIDTAKAAWVFYERPELAGKPILPKVELNLRQKARFLSVPTTSGTGADVTWVAVLTDTVKQQKRILAHNDIVPDVSVLDPELTVGMPAPLTASTGLDVLAHAVDGFTSKQQTDFSDGLCLQAMKMVFEWLPKAYRDGGDLTAREKMQNAATIAGLGFGNSNTGLSHALAHAVGALFHIAHGRAVGIALPYSLAYIASHPSSPKAPDPVERLAFAAGFIGIQDGSDRQRIEEFIKRIRKLQKATNEPSSLREAGITEEQMDEGMEQLVQLAGNDPNMFTTPCPCNGKDLTRLFMDTWKGF
jgi:alcohol dehydrogenase class IV